MIKNFHKRVNYEYQLFQLAKQAGDKLDSKWNQVSNREILLMINSYLKHFNCVQFSIPEIDRISRLMNH